MLSVLFAELARVAQAGYRAVLFYLVQRTDAHTVRVAADIDPGIAHLGAKPSILGTGRPDVAHIAAGSTG